MKELSKVAAGQIYSMWKNFSIALLLVVAVIAFGAMFPAYMSPAISLVAAGGLYVLIFNNRIKAGSTCELIPYSMLIALVAYSFIIVIISLLSVWDLVPLPDLFVFSRGLYIPVLFLAPVIFVTMTVIYMRRKKLLFCQNCKVSGSTAYEQGRMGGIFSSEAHFQLRNLILLFGLLSAISWCYYLFIFSSININQRDTFVFRTFTLVLILADEFYFIVRYYNLYLDLKEQNETLSPSDLENLDSAVYLRYYVVCQDDIYCNYTTDTLDPSRQVIDTPFFVKVNASSVSYDQVRQRIVQMTGIKDGELRFFYGRKWAMDDKRSIMRYFYFLDGKTSDYPQLATEGKWMPYSEVKRIYSIAPRRLASLSVTDTTRLATIILTEKRFDAQGRRKVRLKSYKPTFNLIDVRKSELDFQDDKWLRVSVFNADSRFYHLRRMLRRLVEKPNRSANTWTIM